MREGCSSEVVKVNKLNNIYKSHGSRWLRILLTLALTLSSLVWGAGDEANTDDRRFTYSWQFQENSDLAPRGGTSRGMAVEMLGETNPAWTELQNTSLTDFEKDRLAILAMAGEYRASFDFIETLGFTENHIVTKPYQSWGTEYIFVVEDSGTYISLQHILVMTVETAEGKRLEPMTMKHWRQDWTYEDTQLNVYQGDSTWRLEKISPQAAQGKWSQAVYQVDDSPRYEAVGEWQHLSGTSFWLSGETRRPVPRRERSVRQDYDYLLGTNRHTITPTGWTQEEDNLKIKMPDNNAGSEGEVSVIAREAGLNRYEKIVGYDFSPALAYWQNTDSFWSKIRSKWAGLLAENNRYRLVKGNAGASYLMSVLIEGDKISRQGATEETQDEFVESLFSQFVQTQPD
jgi:hypothetical protein